MVVDTSRGRIVLAWLVLASVAASLDAGGFSGGKFDVTAGCTCHCANASSEVVPSLQGLPAQWEHGATYTLTVSFTGGPAGSPGGMNVGGFNLQARHPADASVGVGTFIAPNGQVQVQLGDAADATHTTAGNDQSSWTIQWRAPDSGFHDARFTLYTNSVNGDGANGFGNCSDRWNTVTVTVPGPEPPPDETPPVITNVVATPSATSATVRWNTDEPATSAVDYGLDASYGTTLENASPVTAHQLTLSSLQQETTYHFRVRSTDAAGNEAATGDLTFTTTGDVTPPSAALVRPSLGHLYLNDQERPHPLGAGQDPWAAGFVLRVRADARDAASGVDEVEFYVDGALRFTTSTPLAGNPTVYEFLWPLASEVPGAHALRARAVDNLGNSATSLPLTVLVL